MPSQADTDGIALVLGWLRSHPRVLALYDGDPARIDGEAPRPPYPRLRVAPLPSPALRVPFWICDQDVQLSSIGPATPEVGSAVLRRNLATVVEALLELPAAPVLSPSSPVVTAVTATAGLSPVPDLGGHNRWVVPVRVTYHPPAVSA